MGRRKNQRLCHVLFRRTETACCFPASRKVHTTGTSQRSRHHLPPNLHRRQRAYVRHLLQQLRQPQQHHIYLTFPMPTPTLRHHRRRCWLRSKQSRLPAQTRPANALNQYSITADSSVGKSMDFTIRKRSCRASVFICSVRVARRMPSMRCVRKFCRQKCSGNKRRQQIPNYSEYNHIYAMKKKTVVTFLCAISRWVRGGCGIVPRKVFQARMKTCRACSSYCSHPEKCAECDCYLNAKNWADTEWCPKKKWGIYL